MNKSISPATMKKTLSTPHLLFLMILAASLALITLLVAASSDHSAAATAPALAMAGIVIPGAAGGRHTVDGPLTTSLAKEGSPDLLLNEVDQRITKIRPSATPVDQISRVAGARPAGAMIVDYYSVDTKPSEATVTEAVTEDVRTTDAGGALVFTLKTSADQIFEPSETILIPSATGYDDQGHAAGTLVLYVVSRDTTAGLRVTAVNGKPDRNNPVLRLPGLIDAGAVAVRMGRAAAELDVQTAQFNALPVKASNFCQIFKAQVEQSTYQKIADKEVGWDFSDQEEVAVIDMRMGMERNFLFGHRARIFDPEKREDVMLTGGIWHQAGADFSYSTDMSGTDFIVSLTRTAFTGNAGSTRKILVAGTDLIEYLNKLDYQRTAGPSDVVTHWGIDFRELHSKFGTLYVVHSEVFDACGHSADGLVIDPEYLTKYTHVPFGSERLDLKSSGQRNTDAVVLTEASCLVLRYPRAHVRVTLKADPQQ